MDRRTFAFLKVVAPAPPRRPGPPAGRLRAPRAPMTAARAPVAGSAAPATPAAAPPTAALERLSRRRPAPRPDRQEPAAASRSSGPATASSPAEVSELHASRLPTPMVELLRGADCAWGNCGDRRRQGRRSSTRRGERPGDPHVCGDPWTADELRWMGFTLMGTANNHTVDYGEQGLISTLENLDRVGIAHAGSGLDLEQAARPRLRRLGRRAGRPGQLRLDLPALLRRRALPTRTSRDGPASIR